MSPPSYHCSIPPWCRSFPAVKHRRSRRREWTCGESNPGVHAVPRCRYTLSRLSYGCLAASRRLLGPSLRCVASARRDKLRWSTFVRRCLGGETEAGHGLRRELEVRVCGWPLGFTSRCGHRSACVTVGSCTGRFQIRPWCRRSRIRRRVLPRVSALATSLNRQRAGVLMRCVGRRRVRRRPSTRRRGACVGCACPWRSSSPRARCGPCRVPCRCAPGRPSRASGRTA